jgi:NADH-quinone oxidoreductase subunit A
MLMPSPSRSVHQVNPVPQEVPPLWPLAVYGGAAVLVVAALIALSRVLGERHRERATNEPYESGIAPTGTTHIRFDVTFYLVAVFFLLFDLEAAFLYAWAVSVRETGWAGFMEALVFIAFLAAALFYLWRSGALDWGRQRRARGPGDGGRGTNT